MSNPTSTSNPPSIIHTCGNFLHTHARLTTIFIPGLTTPPLSTTPMTPPIIPGLLPSFGSWHLALRPFLKTSIFEQGTRRPVSLTIGAVDGGVGWGERWWVIMKVVERMRMRATERYRMVLDLDVRIGRRARAIGMM